MLPCEGNYITAQTQEALFPFCSDIRITNELTTPKWPPNDNPLFWSKRCGKQWAECKKQTGNRQTGRKADRRTSMQVRLVVYLRLAKEEVILGYNPSILWNKPKEFSNLHGLYRRVTSFHQDCDPLKYLIWHPHLLYPLGETNSECMCVTITIWQMTHSAMSTKDFRGNLWLVSFKISDLTENTEHWHTEANTDIHARLANGQINSSLQCNKIAVLHKARRWLQKHK